MRSKLLMIVAVLTCGLISACGGGGGGSGGSSSGGATQDSSINVTLSVTSASAVVTDDDTLASFNVTATLAQSGTISTPVVADVQFDKTVFESVTATAGTTPNTYVVVATTLPNLDIKDYNGTIDFRLCQDVACTKVYSGSSVSYAYKLTVKLGDWVTYQRNAAHTGYVPVTLDPTKFAKAWAWRPSDPYQYLMRPVTGDGAVFFANLYTGEVYSFDELKGTQNWARAVEVISPGQKVGDLAYENGKVYVPTSKRGYPPSEIVIKALNAADGTQVGSFAEPGRLLSGTDVASVRSVAHKGTLYFPSGPTNAGKVYAFNAATAAQKWTGSASAPNADYSQIMALDNQYIYYYTGANLAFFNTTDGALVAKIADPNVSSTGTFNTGAPVVGKGTVIAKSAVAYDRYKFTQFDIVNRTTKWSTQFGYETTPAVAKGVIYAVRNQPDLMLDAISETDGMVLWSTPLPAAKFLEEADTNVIVTNNLIFVATNLFTYAIDINTRQIVWTYPAGGDLALSPGYVLYIGSDHVYRDALGGDLVTDRLIAIKLK